MTESLSRRNFLGAMGAASIPMLWNPAALKAAPLVADPQFKFAFDPNARKVKTGIIGVGGRGTSLLREVLKAGQAEMVAICDIDPEALARATALCAGMSPKGYDDYKNLLADKNVEAVIIATPVDLHCDMAVHACEADKHIYCEKPLGLNAKEAEKVYAATQKLNKTFQVGFQWIYNSNFRAAIEAVHAGLIGDVKFIHAQRHGGDLPHKKSWLFEADRSGDIIVEQAVHEMNIFCWGLKSQPVRACGLGGTNVYVNVPPGRTIMDHYSMTYEFPGPVHLSYSHLYYAHPQLAKTHIWFFGTKGAVDVMGGEIYLNEGEAPAPREMKLTGEDTYNALVSFMNDVRSGGKPDASAERGLLATKMAVLGRNAIREEKVVYWDKL